MAAKKLMNISWYTDLQSVKNGEPGICHSLMQSTATALNYIDKNFNPVWLMGSSAFAFRILVSEIQCPSAMSMFSFKDLIPETLKQAGYDYTYIDRMWNEKKSKEKQMEAHKSIIIGINNGKPAICWDISEAEWGLIIGYDDAKAVYYAMKYNGSELLLPYDKLGENGINILSVCVPGNPNSIDQDKVIMNSLKTAVIHAEGKEFIDERPKYQNGFKAFDLWANVYEKWALLIESGKSENIGVDLGVYSLYYAEHYYSARCYAREYLKMIAGDNKNLKNASIAFGEVAEELKNLWLYFSQNNQPTCSAIKLLAHNIRKAKTTEKKAIELIKQELTEF